MKKKKKTDDQPPTRAGEDGEGVGLVPPRPVRRVSLMAVENGVVYSYEGFAGEVWDVYAPDLLTALKSIRQADLTTVHALTPEEDRAEEETEEL